MIAGTYDLGQGSLLHVSRGTGTWGPPIRFLAPPEVTVYRTGDGRRLLIRMNGSVLHEGHGDPLLCLLLVLSGCMTERVEPVAEYPSVPKQTHFLVQKIEYDEYGRPLFRDQLDSVPATQVNSLHLCTP